MGFSDLVSGVTLSPNKSSRNGTLIDSVAIHTMAGNCTAEGCGAWFSNSSTQASSNYGIDSEGVIWGYVDESERSWCTSNGGVDRRSITIEVASTTDSEPFECTQKAYYSLINLLVDICRRYNMRLKWQNNQVYAMNASNGGPVDDQNMFVHRWFNTSKSCPGQYLFSMHSQIASDVNSKLYTQSSQSSQFTDTKKIVFIGDTRIAGIESSIGTNPHIWSCSRLASYSWLTTKGVPNVESKIVTGYSVCISIGATDIVNQDPYSYSQFINECASRWKLIDVPTYFVSINPVGNMYNGTYDNVTNEMICEYNQKIRDSLNSDVGYIDTYSSIINNYFTTDGLNYDKQLSVALYHLISGSVNSDDPTLYSNSAEVGGTIVQIDYTQLNPYIVTLDRYSPDNFQYGELKSSGVVGAVIEGGFLYDDYHYQVKFRQPKFESQLAAVSECNLPYGFFFIIRSRNLSEASSEMKEITYLLRLHPCKLGVWLKLEFQTGQVNVNNNILSYFQKCLIQLGYASKIGFYVDKSELNKFTWSKFSSSWLLWLIDHVADSSEIKRLLDSQFFILGG